MKKKSLIDRGVLCCVLVSELESSFDWDNNSWAAKYRVPVVMIKNYALLGEFDIVTSVSEKQVTTLANERFEDAAEVARLITLFAQAAAVVKKRALDKNVPKWQIDDALHHSAALELVNKETNEKFRNLDFSVDELSLLIRARHYLQSALPVLDHVWEEVMELMTFGSGSVFSGAERSLYSRVSEDQTVSVNSLGLVGALLEYSPALFKGWAENGNRLIHVTGNKVSHVPKDVRKCRAIAIEPSLNIIIQIGIGKYLAKVCSRIGQDISDQERNRDLALASSVDAAYATIDLSDASSLISVELVKFLLPPDWFAFLDSARSSHNCDGVRWESFSTQGNGFTFPLETLIFWSISKAACEGARRCFKLSIYGDDIIVPTEFASGVMNALSAFGLKVNSEKSFFGNEKPCFRESCGLDAFGGHNVRPIFYKEEALRPSDVAKLHNGLFLKYGYSIPETVSYLRRSVPKRLSGPYGIFTTSDDDPETNTLFIPSFQWFIDETYRPPVKWKPKFHDSEVTFRCYHVSNAEYKETPCHPDLLLQIIMYGGVSYKASPVERLSTRVVSTTLGAIVLT